jgi:CRP-like cAMP-binding protein
MERNLRSFPLFRDFTEADIQDLMEIVRPRHFKPSSVLFSEGDLPDGLYILLLGEVEISKKSPKGGEETLATLTPGAILGEMGVIDNRPRVATARAKNKVETFWISRSLFEDFLAQCRPSAIKILRTIALCACHRLAAMDEKITELLSETDTERYQEFNHFKKKLLQEWNF